MSDVGSILSGGLLEIGRNAFQTGRTGGRIGLSASSRQQLESFFSNATALFNTLYANAEDQEVYNVTTIKALRSKYSYLVSESITGTAKSNTTGTQVDTEA